ncbi:unnamed protein product, partial [Gongylonema pulchrum]|uniref:Secreted protein n=1 Tax=Gongylonema pulchrum TaxID=637853 RepID=A0A183DJC3_9BILA
MPHAWMWRWSDFASSFMLLCLTLDRLLSVKLPIRYITSGTKYSTRVITF